MPLPTIIYTGIAFTVFILGTVLYLTATDFRLEDILSLLPRTLVSIQKHIDKRKIGALVLVIIGLLGSITFSDRLIAEAGNPPGGGGGTSIVPCQPPIAFLPCFPPSGQNSTNICLGTNIGTASCQLPSCGSDTAIFQCGTVTFTITSPAASNTQTITFSPSFATIPKHFALDLPTPAVWPTVSLTTPASLATYCFICSNAPGAGAIFTWTNMPVATTEIFADANREHQIVTTSGGPTGANFRFSVDCNSGSSSAAAALQVQWSTDDATWSDLANTAGQGNIPIDTAVDCPGAGTIISANNGNVVTLNTGFPVTGNKVFLRVVGINGNGVGDSPSFDWLQLSIRYAALVVADPCVLDQPAPGLTATSATVRLRCFAATTVTVTFRWAAQV